MVEFAAIRLGMVNFDRLKWTLDKFMIRLLISARLDIYLQFCYKNYKPHICLNLKACRMYLFALYITENAGVDGPLAELF